MKKKGLTLFKFRQRQIFVSFILYKKIFLKLSASFAYAKKPRNKIAKIFKVIKLVRV